MDFACGSLVEGVVCMIDYRCGECFAENCKLWRNGSSGNHELVCWMCLEGRGHLINVNLEPPYKDDQVYNSSIEPSCYLPAVPTLSGDLWGYTTVPAWWIAWWEALPDTREDCTICCGTSVLRGYDCCFCKGTGRRAEQGEVSA